MQKRELDECSSVSLGCEFAASNCDSGGCVRVNECSYTSVGVRTSSSSISIALYALLMAGYVKGVGVLLLMSSCRAAVGGKARMGERRGERRKG